MRILYIDEISCISGGENWFLNYVRGLPDNTDVEPVLLCPEGSFAQAARENGVTVIPYKFRFRDVSSHRIINYVLFSICRIWDSIYIGILCKRKKINIIHSISTSGHVIAGLIRKLFRVKVLWHIHYQHQPILYRWLSPDYIVFVAQFRQRILNEASVKNIPHHSVIYNGIDSEQLKAVIPVNNDYIHIGYISRLIPEKGIEEFIAAAEILRNSHPRMRFDVFGEEIYNTVLKGKYTDFLKRMIAEKKLSKNLPEVDLPPADRSASGGDDILTMHGFVSQQTEIFSRINIFVLPSYSLSESCPMVVLESWASGVPVIAADNAGVPELITHGETGWLVPPRNPQAIADAIVYVLEHPEEVKRVVENARRLVREKFDYRENARAFVQLYRELLDERP